MRAALAYRGALSGHGGWVTAIATTDDPDVLLTASRDKTLILWQITREEGEYGYPKRILHGQ